MSAGDVLFVGWTGGSPNYKELAPKIQIEPLGQNISKRITINRVCFDKDKQAVIQQLPTGNAVISSTYLDTDGSVKTQTLGGGYTLLNVSDSVIAHGFSRISATYSKAVLGIFELGLPQGLSISCASGKCQIKYNNTTLEEIDSGTGECTSGLELDISTQIYRINLPEEIIIKETWFGGQRINITVDSDGNIVTRTPYSATSPSFYPITYRQFNSFPDFVSFDATLKCNGVEIEDVQITNRSIYDLESVTFEGEVVAGALREGLTTTELEAITQGAFEQLQENPPENLTPISCRYELFRLNSFNPATRVVVTGDEEYYRVIPTYTYTYAKGNYLPRLEWKKTGNIITLQFGRAKIREYDITGIT